MDGYNRDILELKETNVASNPMFILNVNSDKNYCSLKNPINVISKKQVYVLEQLSIRADGHVWTG